ncbi:MAG: response regulator [Clostridia bacterium]|nr:response regulator [Clostridia bacterium]
MNKRRFLYFLLTIVITIGACPCFFSDIPVAFGDEAKSNGLAEINSKEVSIFEKRSGVASFLYDNTSGLPASEANAIAQSSDGFLWIGGYSGLVRYDGNTFERIDLNKGINSVVSLFVDSSDALWIGTNESGVARVKPNSLKMFSKEDGMGSASVRSMAEDADGNVYFATTNGVDYIDSRFKIHNIKDDRILYQNIQMIKAAPDGAVLGVTKSGDIFVIRDKKIVAYYDGETIGIGEIYCIIPDEGKEGYVYIGTTGSKVFYGNLKNGFKNYKDIDIAPLEHINSIDTAYDSYYFSCDNGIGVYNDNGFKKLENLPMTNSVESMMMDYQGNLWFASSKQGIMKLVSSPFVDISKEHNLSSQVVNATCIYKDKLIIGCKNMGLTILQEDGTVSDLPVTSAVTASGKPIAGSSLTDMTKESTVRSIIKDSGGRLWISSYGKNSLICYDNGRLTCFTEEDGLPSQRIRVVCELADGRYAVAGTGGISIIKDNVITKVYDESDGIKNLEILTVVQAENGDIIAGTDGGGLYIISDFGVRQKSTDNGLTSDVIMRLKVDAERNIIWMVTSNSIAYMDENYNVINIDTFPYTNNFDLYSNDRGETWILSSNGIYIEETEKLLKNENLNPYHYSIYEGLPYIAAANSYSYLAENGNLYIAGSTGVACVNMNEPIFATENVKITTPYLEIDGKRIYPDENNEFVINSDAKTVKIFTHIFTYTQVNPKIDYQLKGFETEMNSVDRKDFAGVTYTNLSGGDYEFVVQIADPKGKVHESYSVKLRKEFSPFEYTAVRLAVIALGIIAVTLAVWRIMHATVISRQYVQIRMAKEEAERANTAKSRFLANMSHEIRTPINTIMGMNEMILREDMEGVPKETSDSILQYATDIKRASDTLLELINELLDLSKIESGKMNLVEMEYDVKEFISSIAMMIRVRSKQRDLIFETEIDENIPKKLYGDEKKLKEVLLNLLTNALKYTNDGGFKLIVSLKEKQDGMCSIYFAVKDTGIGVKPEDMDRLFSAFERLDEKKNTGIQGTGLGLDISRKFVDLMGGELLCDSVYGQGSTFYFTVKQKIVDEEPLGKFVEEEVKIKDVYFPQFVAPEGKVLVVDDNEMNLQVIKGLLKATKLQLTMATSGRQCLELLEKEEFNVVLLDHMMPEMDGIQTLKEMRNRNIDLPVIALTANIMSGGSEYYKQLGFQDYLAKPVEGVALEKMIKKYLPAKFQFSAAYLIKDEEEKERESEDRLSEELLWLESTEGISVEDGMKYCGGSESFEMTLNTFFEMIDENSNVIEKAYTENDIELYTIKVHALKSSARIIGASKLSEMALALENAGKSGDIEYIKNNTDSLLSEYRSYKTKLGRLAKNEPANEEKTEISKEEVKELFEAVKLFAEQMDYEACEMTVEQLKGCRLSEEDETVLEKITGMLKKLDWEGLQNLEV